MIDEPLFIILTPLAIIVSALIAWFGNYWVHRKNHDYLRLLKNVDDLKGRLYEFVDLSVNYWTLDGPREEKHQTLEARMIARKRIILEEFSGLGGRNRRLGKLYQQTTGNRLDLWNAATGGCFQRAQWQKDPERVTRVTAEACRIIQSLNQAY